MIRIFNKRALSVLLSLVMLLSFCSNLLLSNYSINANAISYVLREMNWEQAAKDGCSNGFFHNAVQDYLIDKENGFGFKRELKIEYNQIVVNPVTKQETTYGKADLYKEVEGNTYYLWEVKPVSYNNAQKKKLAIQQLDNYTNNKLHKNGYITYIKGGLDTPLDHTTKFQETVPNHKAKYEITFWGTSDSLILYKFQRLPDKNNDDSEEAENTDANANASSNSVFNDTHSNAQKEAMNGLIDDDSIINHKGHL